MTREKTTNQLKRTWIQLEIAKREKTNDLWMIDAQIEQTNQTTMIRKPTVQHPKSKIQINNLYEAVPLEVRLRRKMKGGKVDEEEGDGKTWAIAYTEKRDGVRPEYDIRTDRFEIAREAMETLEKGIQLSYSDPLPADHSHLKL